MILDNPEYLYEEPTPIEIADACRGKLDDKVCDEIAAMENSEEALGLAFTALEEVGVDPEEFLKEKRILE